MLEDDMLLTGSELTIPPGATVTLADHELDLAGTDTPVPRPFRSSLEEKARGGLLMLVTPSAQRTRVARYAVTSGIALGVSELTLLVLYAHGISATCAALLANVVGTVPSYLLSRYWIWADAPRKRVGRQVVLYWSTSLVSMALTSVLTGAITAAAPAGHRAHLVVAGGGYLVVSFLMWVAKFVMYQRVIFPVSRRRQILASSTSS